MYMWGYFEKFIVLMQPENMAALMERIFPQMMDAMPPGMKPMMQAMKHVPGGLAMMEKMMPKMFPCSWRRHHGQGDAGHDRGGRGLHRTDAR
jgi:hypothetical protein